MNQIRLGRTGVEVPFVSLGTWSHGGPSSIDDRAIGWSGYDAGAQQASLRAAWEAGITHWDTADVYGGGRSEELIGGMWARGVPRQDLFLASKVGWAAGPHDHYYEPSWVRHQLEGSLRRLRTDYLDLYYLHHCHFGPDDRYLDGALEVIRRAQEQGLLRFVGLSDWNSAAVVRVVARVDPDVIQPYRSVVHDTYASSGLKAWVEAHDVGLAFFSPLRHGLLLGKYEAPTEFGPGDFRDGDDWFRDAEILERLRGKRRQLEARFGSGTGPVLRALVQALGADAPTACVLLGQRSPAQVSTAAAAGVELDGADAASVRALFADLAELSEET